MTKKYLLFFIVSSLFGGELFYYDNGKKIYLEEKFNLRSSNGVHFFRTSRGTDVGIKNRLIIKTKDINQIKDLLTNLKFIKDLGDNLYLFEANSTISAISEANRLNNENNIEFAVPEFYKRITIRWDFLSTFF